MICNITELNSDESTTTAEMTPAMIDAGTERLLELLEAGVD